MPEDATFRENLIAAIPSLRAFAFSLLKDRDRADDIVQDTIVRAWQHRDRFEEGTNFGAWLFTILRNLVYSAHRKRVREVEDADGSYSARLKTHPDQQSHLDFEDFQRALQTIPLDQREALLLVAAEGLSYEEAAEITGVAVGTVKSRVNRARGRLARLLAVERDEDVGPDSLIKAAMQG
jgi:RNA polymerase sigma-70 factor (ECF subfamily)